MSLLLHESEAKPRKSVNNTDILRLLLHTVQLNLKLTRHACGMYLKQHVFHFASVQACTHKIDAIETLVQSTRVCTRRVAEERVHVRYVHTKSCMRAPWRVYKL